MQLTDEAVDAAIKKLAFEDVVQFFSARVKQHTCPCCFENNWAFVGDPNHTIALMALHKNGSFSLPPPSVPIFSIACNNCGFVRTHALGIVAKWKLSQDAEKS